RRRRRRGPCGACVRCVGTRQSAHWCESSGGRPPRDSGRWKRRTRAFRDRGARQSIVRLEHGAGLQRDVREARPMKWSTMNSRDRRAVTIGGLVLLPALLFIWAVRPYQAALSDARDELATERATLARERAAILTARKNPQLQHIADSAMRVMRPRLFEGRD